MVTEVFECVRQTVPAKQKVIQTPHVTILARDEQLIRCETHDLPLYVSVVSRPR